MAICPFFVSGKCTYGSKCYNLHVDIGQAVQTTVKASVAGKQWLLSTFAPFEGDSDLPDYIEDQSFEEVRSEFYAARNTNTEHLAKQKFNQSWADAQRLSMQMINQDQSVLAYLVNTFGINGTKRKQNTPTATPNQANPFGQAAAIPAPMSGSIFGGGGAVRGPATGGSIFGASANSGVHATGASIFGASANSGAPATGGSIFGATANSAVPATGGSIFGATAGSGGSIFGGQSVVQAPQSTGNIFGQPQLAATPQQQPSIFGGSALSAANATPSVFAQQNQAMQPANLANPGGNIFSQNVFGATAAALPQQPPVANTGNIFGQSQQPRQPQANIFQQHAQQQSIFAQVPQQQQQQAPPPNPFQNASPFGAPPQTSAVPSGNVFGNLGQTANQAAQVAVLGGIINNGSAPSGENVFGASPFGGGGQQMGSYGSGQPLVTESMRNDKAYSKSEELDPNTLMIYQSKAPFELGKIPNVPPPRNMCL